MHSKNAKTLFLKSLKSLENFCGWKCAAKPIFFLLTWLQSFNAPGYIIQKFLNFKTSSNHHFLLCGLCSIAWLFPCQGNAESQQTYNPLSVYLTWQRQPESTMTINWITPLDRKDDEIEYRQQDKEKWTQVTGTHRLRE